MKSLSQIIGVMTQPSSGLRVGRWLAAYHRKGMGMAPPNSVRSLDRL